MTTHVSFAMWEAMQLAPYMCCDGEENCTLAVHSDTMKDEMEKWHWRAWCDGGSCFEHCEKVHTVIIYTVVACLWPFLFQVMRVKPGIKKRGENKRNEILFLYLFLPLCLLASSFHSGMWSLFRAWSFFVSQFMPPSPLNICQQCFPWLNCGSSSKYKIVKWVMFKPKSNTTILSIWRWKLDFFTELI